MQKFAYVLIGFSILGFFLAIISIYAGGSLLHVSPEGFSRACSNLALIAIAIAVWFKNDVKP